MRPLRRLLDETQERIEQGRSLKALEPLSQASALLRLLMLDGEKVKRA
jgi:hypothetical protein